MRFAMPMISVPVCAMPMRIHLRTVVVAEKCHKEQPEHVERCDEGGNDANQPVHPTSMLAGKRLPENFVLAPEACEWRDSSDRQCRNAHGQERPGNVGAQPAHLAHVLFAADGVT